MGGWIFTALGIVASLLLWRTGHPSLFWAAVIATALEFWSHGIMSNFAMDLARVRHDRLRENMILEGREHEALDRLDGMPVFPTDEEINAMPDGITRFNMMTSLVVLGLFVAAAVVRLR